jgi:hypothetical protein
MVNSVAVLSDIHGVMPALDAVLAEPDLQHADRIVLTGDIAAGPQPTQVLDRLLGLGDKVIWVRGNADRELVELARGEVDDVGDPIAPWAARQLSPDHVGWLADLPHPVTLSVDGFGERALGDPVRWCGRDAPYRLRSRCRLRSGHREFLLPGGSRVDRLLPARPGHRRRCPGPHGTPRRPAEPILCYNRIVERQVGTALYVVALIVVVVCVDIFFFRHQFVPRLLVNIGIVAAFAVAYLTLVKRP